MLRLQRHTSKRDYALCNEPGSLKYHAIVCYSHVIGRERELHYLKVGQAIVIVTIQRFRLELVAIIHGPGEGQYDHASS